LFFSLFVFYKLIFHSIYTFTHIHTLFVFPSSPFLFSICSVSVGVMWGDRDFLDNEKEKKKKEVQRGGPVLGVR
jgi:hypothetical protein